MFRNTLKRWWYRRDSRRQARAGSRLARNLRWGWRILLVLVALDVFYLMSIWPDWQRFGRSGSLKSQFILNYEDRRKRDASMPPLRWTPIAGEQMPRDLRRAVITAEDARFYSHHGIDLLAFLDAMDTNLELKEFKYGASTISQQTIKNLYFSSARNPLRKWHELVLTLGMEMKVSKQRILTTYLNIAEFGEGIYGAEAAAQYYWHIPARLLNERQCAELAASLPSPKKSNPQTRSRYFTQRAEKIYNWLQKQDAEK
jgi:monofunctional biosynthetic peptidoglycan transglycosylase